MWRLLNRVTLGAGNQENNVSAENLSAEVNQGLPVEQEESFALNQFDNNLNQQVNVNNFELNNIKTNNCDSDFESESDIEEVDSDLRDNLLITRKYRKNGYTNRVITTRGTRNKKKNMRLTSRKRHVVASSNGSQLSYHHPTIQAKQNQMYLITSLGPNQMDQESQDLINQLLPKELLLRVFSYLDIVSLCRAAQVCRYWNNLAMDGSNWQQVDLFYFQKDIRPAVVENLAKRCGGFLKILNLHGCENVQDSALRSFAMKCPNIERLWLKKCKRVTDDTSEFLGKFCHRLVTLDLENCVQITDKSLRYIGSGCKYLEELNISWCQNVTDKGISMIADGCPYLKVLLLKGCEGISTGIFSNLKPDSFKELKILNLLSCVNITDETVEDISKHCHELEYLCLSNCREITDRSLVALSQGCQHLNDLELALCNNLTDAGFIQLSKNCHELERMDLEDCNLITDVTLHNLNIGCPNLHSLSLSHCELLTDNGLSEFCGSHKDKIKVLELDNCPQITDAAFEFLKPLKVLEKVDVYDCQNITKEAIKRFTDSRPEVKIQAYFAPQTPPPPSQPSRQGICRCCNIL